MVRICRLGLLLILSCKAWAGFPSQDGVFLEKDRQNGLYNLSSNGVPKESLALRSNEGFLSFSDFFATISSFKGGWVEASDHALELWDFDLGFHRSAPSEMGFVDLVSNATGKPALLKIQFSTPIQVALTDYKGGISYNLRADDVPDYTNGQQLSTWAWLVSPKVVTAEAQLRPGTFLTMPPRMYLLLTGFFLLLVLVKFTRLRGKGPKRRERVLP
jgi:hypothetical protein